MPANLTLPELAARYNITDIYGATIAYFSSEEGGRHDLRSLTDRICCYELNLLLEGQAQASLGGHDYNVGRGALLVLTPYQPVRIEAAAGATSVGLLVDRGFYDSILLTNQGTDAQIPGIPSRYNTIYQLNEEQTQDLAGIFGQIQRAIHYMHLYKEEMLRALMHICKLFISELPYNSNSLTPDFRHKENIYRIFLHLLEMNFRHERQLQFYADKLSVSTTYLSRVVKEISGNTVNDHITNRTFHEACNMLSSTDKTIGEIAFALGFKDQSALTNFFKLHAHCSPREYRQRKTAGWGKSPQE